MDAMGCFHFATFAEMERTSKLMKIFKLRFLRMPCCGRPQIIAYSGGNTPGPHVFPRSRSAGLVESVELVNRLMGSVRWLRLTQRFFLSAK